MKTQAFQSIKAYLAILVLAILLASCKKAVVQDGETTTFSAKKSMTSPQGLLPGGSTRTVGYFTIWNTGTEDWSTWIDNTNVEQYSDLIFAFINPDASGNFTITPSLTAAITKAHNAGVSRVFIGISSNTPNSDVSNQVNNNRANFITNIRNFAIANNLQGVDLDFEGNGIIPNFNSFVTQLADDLHAHSLKLSVAIARWQANAISAAAYNSVDYLNVMSYDHGSGTNTPGPHSSYENFTLDFTTFKTKMNNNA